MPNRKKPILSFAEAVRAAVRQIPEGETRSYSEIADRVGSPQGARAVARVMKENYDPTVPCHRVIRKSGAIGGYNRGGEAVKRAMLQSEGAIK